MKYHFLIKRLIRKVIKGKKIKLKIEKLDIIKETTSVGIEVVKTKI